MGETPVSIPNTMVKPQAADGTALETVWESRWLPNLLEKKRNRFYDIDTGMTKWSKERVYERVVISTQPAGKCCYDNWFYQ